MQDKGYCTECDKENEECNCEYYNQMTKEYSWMAGVVRNYPELFNPKNAGKTKDELINSYQ